MDNISESCRVCLKKVNECNLSYQIEDYVPELPHTTWMEMFLKVSGYDISEIDPKCICELCATELVTSFSFITKCNLTEEALISYRTNKTFDINLNHAVKNLIASTASKQTDNNNDDAPNVTNDEVLPTIIFNASISEGLIMKDNPPKPSLSSSSETVLLIDKYDDDISSPGTSDEETTNIELSIIRQNVGYTCFIADCDTYHKSLNALHEHVRTNHAVMKCPLCQCYLAPDTYGQHLKVDHKSNGRKVSCEICNKVMDCKQFSQHLSKIHGISMEGKRAIKLKCKALNCHETIFTKERWRFHTIYSHARVKCSVCNFLLSGIRFVPKHFRDFHGQYGFDFVQFVPEPTDFTESAAYRDALKLVRYFNSAEYRNSKQTCGICGKQFVGYKKLNTHIRLNHGGHETAQICQHCGVNCRTLANLKIHLESHSTEQYECHICGSFIKTKMNLKNHMALVHLKNRSYPCNVEGCKRIFPYWGSLNYHRRSVHGIVKKRENRNFQPLGLPKPSKSRI